MGVVIVEGEGAVLGEFGAFHCNQWDGDALSYMPN